MKRLQGSRRLLHCKKNRRDDRGSAIVIVIIAMALIGILASTILWSAYLNYRIKINDLKVKNSFYSAETVIEQIVAGVKHDIVSPAINEAYQDVVSNWDALGTDTNRESYFITAYIAAVERKLNVSPSGSPDRYDKSILKDFVDNVLWDESNAQGHIVNSAWDNAVPRFKAANAVNGYGSMAVRNICVEFYDGNGYLSIINTDIAIDVPKLRFTQAGTIDRLYPYVLIGGEGIASAQNTKVDITGSIYGGVDDTKKGGIEIGEHSTVTIDDASYVISGGDIVVGSNPNFVSLINQDAKLIVQNVVKDGQGFRTNVYAQGVAVNGSNLDVSGKMYVANDMILSGRGSSVALAGQYFGYGNTNTSIATEEVNKKDEHGNPIPDGAGGFEKEEQNVNPANTSSAVVINGKDSSVDLTGLTTLQLAGRAYVSLPQDDAADNGLPHVLMGESISVKSNQIAYLVPPECVGTLDGKTIIGQNPVPFATWSKMMGSLSEYVADGQDFRIVDAGRAAVKLGGKALSGYGISDIFANDLGAVDTSDIVQTVKRLNQVASAKGIRFLYMPAKQQVYLYLVMDDRHAAEYFNQYYNVNSNKANLDNYFNQYVSGGIKLKSNVKGYTVAGNSMVSATDENGNILSSAQGQNLVKLLSGIAKAPEEDGTGNPPPQPGDYQEVSDNVETQVNEKTDDELRDIIDNCAKYYGNLNKNLLEEDAGTEDTVFENLVRLDTPAGAVEGIIGLQDYLDANHGKVEFETGSSLKAVFVDSKKSGAPYQVTDSKLRLVVAIGDVEVKRDFQGLIIASGKITVADNIKIKKDGAGVYDVLQAKSEVTGDTNVPANVFYNGSGMIKNGYEGADVDESGNLNIDYSEIVRYENWIKK